MYSTETLLEIKKNVVSELIEAQHGRPSSYPFIRHSLSQTTQIQADETFQTLVIGGSFYRNALLKKDEGKPKIIKDESGELPIFNTANLFLKFIEQQLDKSVRHIAINFAYPLTPILRHNILDGILQSGSKEHKFAGMIDKTVGRFIEEHIKESWNKEIHVAITNDAICLLLSGLLQNSWQSLAAGIVGTGLNFAIFLDEFTAVNLEAANFNKFPQSEEGVEIDNHSVLPGQAKYEKETSGAYLYQHFNHYLKKHNLNFLPLISTEELNGLTYQKIPKISELAQSFLNRSAQLVAAQIAGVLEFSKRDLTFIMQGSLIWNGHGYFQMLNDTVQLLSSTYNAKYIQIKDSDIFGAAELFIHS